MSERDILELILKKVEGIDAKLQEMDGKIQGLEERMDRLEQKIDRLEERMDRLEQRMDHLEERMDRLERRVGSLETRMKDVELTLENETNRNIRLVAEGHLDIHRKLDDAFKSEQQKEMLLIRVNILENEVRMLKDKVGHSA